MIEGIINMAQTIPITMKAEYTDHRSAKKTKNLVTVESRSLQTPHSLSNLKHFPMDVLFQLLTIGHLCPRHPDKFRFVSF